MLYLSPAITAYVLLVAALLGAAMGSFINCAAYRLVRGKSALKGRSECPHCGHVLSGRDLVPVFSYLFLRGRCRYCGEKLSPRYVYVELAGALIFVSMLLRYDISLSAAAYIALLLILLAVSLVDFETMLVPDGLVLLGIGCFILFCLLGDDPLRLLGQGFLGGIATALPLLLFVLLADKLMAKETMGGGDIKLIFMTNLYFGWKCGILLLIISCLFGIVFALAARKKPGMEFPFGPAIGAGAWVCALVGVPLINWYAGLFL